MDSIAQLVLVVVVVVVVVVIPATAIASVHCHRTGQVAFGIVSLGHNVHRRLRGESGRPQCVRASGAVAARRSTWLGIA